MGPAAERWELRSNGQLVAEPGNGGDRCLDVEWASGSDGAMVQVMNGCSAPGTNDAQVWTRTPTENYNYTGLAHVGLLPDFLRDLRKSDLGKNSLDPLFNSAEAFLQTWERTGWTRPLNKNDLSSSALWKYSTTLEASWNTVAFNDLHWNSVKADGGDEGAYGVAPWYSNVAGWPGSSVARWIWSYYSNNETSSAPTTAYFRKVFNGDDSLRTITLTADNQWTVYVDGTLLGPNAPCTANDWTKGCTYVLSPTKNSSGQHVLAIQVNNWGGPGGLLVDFR